MAFLVTEVFGGPKNFFIFYFLSVRGYNFIFIFYRERVSQSKQPSPYPLAVGVIPPYESISTEGSLMHCLSSRAIPP